MKTSADKCRVKPQPRNADVENSRPQWKLPSKEAIGSAIQSVTGLKPVGVEEVPAGREGKTRARITFDGPMRLDGEARKLDRSQIKGIAGPRVYAIERVEVYLRLPATAYQPLCGLFKRCAHDIWVESKVKVSINDEDCQTKGYAAITMSAENRESLVAAKYALDRVILPTQAGKLTPAKQSSKQTHRIRLTKPKHYDAVENGRLQQARAELGEDVVSFDTNAAAITVRGNTSVLRKVQRYLSGAPSEDSPINCPICLDDQDDVFKMEGCEHIACIDCCFQHWMAAGQFPVQCFERACRRTPSMGELRSHLGEEQFQRLLSTAVTDHFNRDVEQYVKCNGPECEAYLLKQGRDSPCIPCASCFTFVCGDCKGDENYHFGKTCEQRNKRKADEEEEGLNRLGIKRCPRCSTRVEKIVGGCDNVQCSCCHQRFCWFCLERYDSQDALYVHQDQAHGTSFTNPQDFVERYRQLGVPDGLIPVPPAARPPRQQAAAANPNAP